MRILVYGAGNMGTLYAALLAQSGENVTVLARGARAAELRDRGVQIQAVGEVECRQIHLQVVESLEPDDAYDLVLVALPAGSVGDILPTLAASRSTPNVLFFGNTAAGTAKLESALGEERVLLGFPGAAAVAEGDVLRYVITSAREQPTTIGEPNGASTARVREIAELLQRAGFTVASSPRMDAWLKTHVAKILPTAFALYAAGGDVVRLARTRDAVVLLVRALREAFRVLSALEIPITPKNHRVLPWLPEPLLVWLMRRMLESDTMELKVGHALEARSEMQKLDAEFRALADASGVPTPAWNRLAKFLDPAEEPMADGASLLPLRWGAVWGLVMGAALLGLALGARLSG